MKTYTFHVSGMHCNSCTILIEESVKEIPEVTSVKVDLNKKEAVVMGNLGENLTDIAERLTKLVASHGYRLFTEKQAHDKKWSEFFYALPIAAVIIVGFLLLQKVGFVNLINTGNVTYGTAFVIGLIASVSTCLAVVGGLVLSMSANYAKEDGKWKPGILFHIGRLTGFFILGGLIGAIGSSFHLGITGSMVLSIIVAIVMLILGVNLLDVIHGAKRFQLTMPKIFAKHTMNAATATHTLAPLLVGIATFFLPCGFTQSMQLYTLTTGSFLRGGLTMATFALGTLPVLAAISFGSISIAHKPWKGIFFKTAGIIVIALALLTLLNSLAVAGIIPLFLTIS